MRLSPVLLASRIAESGYRLNISRMFAALLVLSLAGVAIFFVLSALSHLLLRRRHESAVRQEPLSLEHDAEKWGRFFG